MGKLSTRFKIKVGMEFMKDKAKKREEWQFGGGGVGCNGNPLSEISIWRIRGFYFRLIIRLTAIVNWTELANKQ